MISVVGETDVASILIEAALAGRAEEARALQLKDPKLTERDIYAACAMGDAESVRKLVLMDEDAVSRAGGPREWVPLLYAAGSRMHRESIHTSAGLVECAAILLHQHADADCFYLDRDDPDCKLTALCLACEANNPQMARLLLQAGADVNDDRSLSRACEHSDNACLKVLMEWGAKTTSTNALARKLDSEDYEGVRLLLEHGADPDEGFKRDGTALHHAIRRGRSMRIVHLLVEHGVDLQRRNSAGLTALQVAHRYGRRDVEEALLESGSPDDLTHIDRFIGACARGDFGEVQRIKSTHPSIPADLKDSDCSWLCDMAVIGSVGGVELMLANGVPVDSLGEMGATALHWASWIGDDAVAAVLLKAGANTAIEDADNNSAPFGWVGYGLTHCPTSRGGHYKIAEMLRQAGAKHGEHYFICVPWEEGIAGR